VVLCVALIFLLPFAVGTFVGDYARSLTARARETPLVVGAQGSRFDLVLTTLHFRGRSPRPTDLAELRRATVGDPARPEETAGELGFAIPIHVGHTARGLPVVGTAPEYYELRGLGAASGTLPLRLGEATLGAEAARATGLGVGGRLLTDEGGLFEFGLKQPLLLRVVGVLAPRGTPDDRAVFVDVKTCWVLDGVGHGHADPKDLPANQVLRRDENGAVLAPPVVEAQEITPENAASFHFHGEPETFPLTSILVLPKDERAGTILKGRYRVSKTAQALEAPQVVDELLGFVFQVKRFFDANVLMVSVATALLLGLVFLLTLRVRRRELETLAKIGCARATLVRILATEWAVMLLAGVGLAALLAKTLLAVFLRDLLP
jgi:putative ABC transport system permease protein